MRHHRLIYPFSSGMRGHEYKSQRDAQAKTWHVLTALVAISLLQSATTVFAQAIPFDVSTAPTFVANTGRSEVVGQVTLTADATCGTDSDGLCVSTAGTLQVLYAGTLIDNLMATSNIGTLSTNGIEVCEVFNLIETCNVAGTLLNGSFAVTNTVAGGVVSFGINSGVDLSEGARVIVRGVRGQIDLSPAAIVGTSIIAQMTASPSTIAGFSPTSEVVARSADPLAVSVNPGTVQQCQPLIGSTTVTIREGFSSAFVDHDAGPGDSGPTALLRPSYGATNNSMVNILLTNKPSGVSINWPAVSAVDSGVGHTGALLNLLAQSASGDFAQYVYTAQDQTVSDVSAEIFVLSLTATANILVSGTASDIGTTQLQAQMIPAGFFPSSRPRYSHGLEPVPAPDWLTISPCEPTSTLIEIQASFDGAPWSGTLNYLLSGPGGTSGTTVPAELHDVPSGGYTLFYQSGGPPGAVFSGITPASFQNLPDGGAISFTLNFNTPGTIEVSAILDGVPWEGIVAYGSVGPTTKTGLTVPGILEGLAPGSYSLGGIAGGPDHAVLTGVSPSGTQTLGPGGTVEFVLNFNSTDALQTTLFSLAGTPRLVANTGRSEVLGDLTLAADAACGTNVDLACLSTPGTIQILLPGVPIDNTPSSGICVREVIGGVASPCNVIGSYIFGFTTVINVAAGGVVSFGVQGGLDLAAGDHIIISGIRGQIALGPGSIPGTSLIALGSASPATSAAFGPTFGTVAQSRDPLTVLVNPATILQCIPTLGQATITVIEGFHTAFVDHADPSEISYAGAPANPRPLNGGSRNARVNIVVGNLPSGITINWPLSSEADSGGGNTAARFDRVGQSASGNVVTYVFSTPDQAVSDGSAERFEIVLNADGEISLSNTSGDLGTAQAQGQMHPPAIPTVVRPRYSHSLEPTAAPRLLTVSECGTITDLMLTKRVASDPTLSGGTLEFTIEVVNSSDAPALGVVVTDALPGDVSFGSCVPSAGTCSEGDSIVTAQLGAILPAGHALVEILGTAPIVTDAPAILHNSSTVSTTTAESDPENNEGSVLVHITPVAIDVKPGSTPNGVNPNSNGKIPVAILTTQWFDATTVLPSTARLGPLEALSQMGQYTDVDRDGDMDLLLHFPTELTGIQCEDNSVVLKGETFSGEVFQSSDDVSTSSCK